MIALTLSVASARFSKEHSCPWDTEIPYEDERSLYHSRGVTWWGGDDGVMTSLAAGGHVCAMHWVCKQEGRILGGIKSGAACVAAAGGGHLEALEFAYSKAGILGYNYADEWVIEIYTKTAAIEAVSAGHGHILAARGQYCCIHEHIGLACFVFRLDFLKPPGKLERH